MTEIKVNKAAKGNWGKEKSKTFFKAAGEKAVDLKERNMCFVIANDKGEVFAKDKVKGSSKLFYKTAHGKVLALMHAGGNLCLLETPGNIFELVGMVLLKFPKTIILGSDFTVAGCLPVDIGSESSAERIYVSASGSLDAHNDVLCAEAGLTALGFAPGDDKVWRKKN